MLYRVQFTFYNLSCGKFQDLFIRKVGPVKMFGNFSFFFVCEKRIVRMEKLLLLDVFLAEIRGISENSKNCVAFLKVLVILNFGISYQRFSELPLLLLAKKFLVCLVIVHVFNAQIVGIIFIFQNRHDFAFNRVT
jgi:hypothetical protein